MIRRKTVAERRLHAYSKHHYSAVVGAQGEFRCEKKSIGVDTFVSVYS